MTSQDPISISSSSSSSARWSPSSLVHYDNDSVILNGFNSHRDRGIFTQNTRRSLYSLTAESDEDTDAEMKQTSQLTYVYHHLTHYRSCFIRSNKKQTRYVKTCFLRNKNKLEMRGKAQRIARLAPQCRPLARQNHATIWQTCKECMQYQFDFITAKLFGCHGNIPLENMVQIRHLYVMRFHTVKRLRKSVQYIRRYSTK